MIYTVISVDINPFVNASCDSGGVEFASQSYHVHMLNAKSLSRSNAGAHIVGLMNVLNHQTNVPRSV
jgi:hypothetical protein